MEPTRNPGCKWVGRGSGLLPRRGEWRIAVIAVAMASPPAPAQTVRGIIESDAGDRISGAVVTLLDAQDAALASALSGPIGRFEVTAATVGSYRLRVHRIGYTERTTDPIEVWTGTTSGSTPVSSILSRFRPISPRSKFVPEQSVRWRTRAEPGA